MTGIILYAIDAKNAIREITRMNGMSNIVNLGLLNYGYLMRLLRR